MKCEDKVINRIKASTVLKGFFIFTCLVKTVVTVLGREEDGEATQYCTRFFHVNSFFFGIRCGAKKATSGAKKRHPSAGLAPFMPGLPPSSQACHLDAIIHRVSARGMPHPYHFRDVQDDHIVKPP
eukprot:scaffold3143_cov164-Amphora_coffeaeformis.AAC.1